MQELDTQNILPKQSIDFLNSLDLKLSSVKKLTNDKKLLFLVVSNHVSYVLKVSLPPINNFSLLRYMLLGSLGFQKECDFYKKISNHIHSGNYPAYVGHDKYNLLIEYLPNTDFKSKDLSKSDWEKVGAALANFNYEIKLKSKSLKLSLHHLIYGPFGFVFVTGFPTVKRVLGTKSALSYVFEVLKGMLLQKKMPIKHVNHNDFMPNNFIFTKDSKLYLIDFQDYTEGSKWPLHDLLRLLRSLHNNIDQNFIPVIIDSYLSNMPREVKFDMNVENQIRFSLLKSIIYSLLWRMNNGIDYSENKDFLSSFLKNKQLDEYSQFVLELIKQHINEEKLLLSSF
jgi:hypothetical protein